MDKHLKDIYYNPNNMWMGNKAIKNRKGLWQIHLPTPQNIERSHHNIEIPNHLHQFDVMHMSTERLQGSNYKYILTGIASRYKIARPMRTKTAKDVSK